MGEKIKKIKRIKDIRLHREGTNTLLYTGIAIAMVGALIWYLSGPSILFKAYICLFAILYGIMINFFRCPVRYFNGETENIVVAPADGKVVVIEEVEEDEYFHDKRLMISIFMSLFNVHANWVPVDGTIKLVEHQDGNFHSAWLPKASIENERSTVVITTPDGTEILVRQIAGAMARRIVTYAQPGEDCFIDEHLGFIKFGSRVDLFLPTSAQVCVSLNQKTSGNETIVARLS